MHGPVARRCAAVPGDEVLILGDFRYTPTYCRSIARAGYRPLVVDPARCGFSAASMAAAETFDLEADPDALGSWLVDFAARRPRLAAVIPVGDSTAEILSRVQTDLPVGVATVIGSVESVSACTDKLTMSRLVDEIGVPQATYREAVTLAAATDLIEEIGYPAIVKPSRPNLAGCDVKAWIIEKPSDLAGLRAFPADPPGRFVVQRYVEGGRINVQVLAHEGELVDRVVTVTTRSTRRDDTGNTVASVTVAPPPELDAWTAAVIRRVGFSGFGCLQFYGRLDTGEVTFLELNPRLGGAFGIAERCGVDFPRLALDVWLHGLRPPRRLSDYPAGKHMAWVGGDVVGLVRARREKEIGLLEGVRWATGIVRSMTTANAYTTFTWEDPLLLVRYRWERRFGSRRPSTPGTPHRSDVR